MIYQPYWVYKTRQFVRIMWWALMRINKKTDKVLKTDTRIRIHPTIKSKINYLKVWLPIAIDKARKHYWIQNKEKYAINKKR